MTKHLKTMARMKNIYDLDDYYVLEQEGWHLPSNSTLASNKKSELIGIIRMLEHNWAGSIKATELQSRRLENFYKYYKEIGNEELFTKLTSDDYLGDSSNDK